MRHDSKSNAPRWLEKTSDDGCGAYVHLPFCDRVCPYCDFAVVTFDRFRASRYLRALLLEIERAPKPARRLQTIYFGGGTPSVLPSAALQKIAAAIQDRFDAALGNIELTMEANPARTDRDCAAWIAAGINRLSVGVQSFDDGELHRLGRDHNSQQAREFIAAARSAGFSNISLDLIAGAPGQQTASFAYTLATAIEAQVDHISVYGLTIEEGTPFARWQRRDPSSFPDDDALAELLEQARETLQSAGFAQYEISNFARPGFECAHNVGYWRQRDCLAFGLSAAGYERGTRYQNLRDLASYCVALESGASARSVAEHLDPAARLGEAAILALRTSEGIIEEDFRRRFGVRASETFSTGLDKCMRAGLLEVDARGARLTHKGRLLANSVCTEFLVPELALVKQ